VGELAEGAGERIVGFVICVVLEVVTLPDLVLAVAAVGFVVYEVDLSEESII
jgi:cell division septation protein DedD